MKGQEWFGIYLLFSVVATEQSGACSGVGDKSCQSFPLSLLDWNEETSKVDYSIPDDVTPLNEGGSTSFIERLLLFPVCFFDVRQCDKYAQSDGGKWSVIRMCQDTEESCLLEYTIQTGWQALNGIIESIQQANSVASPQYLHHIYHISSNIVAMFHSTMTSVTTMLTDLGEFDMPDFGIWNTVAYIQELFGIMTWAMIRYVAVSLIALSLFPSRKQLGKIARKSISTAKCLYGPPKEKRGRAKTLQPSLSPISEDGIANLTMVKHYPMCEYFDQQQCNCGGRSTGQEPKTDDEHYKMCEFFDGLPCNCGGVENNTLGTVSGTSVDISFEYPILKPILLTNKDDVGKGTVAKTDPIIDDITRVEMIPQWVQMAVGGLHVQDTNLLTCLGEARDDTATEHLVQCSSPCNVPEYAVDLNCENIPVSPKKVHFDMYIPMHSSEDEHVYSSCLPGIVDDYIDADSEEGSLIRNLNDSSTSDIGTPFLNSSFKEDSPYVTASTVPYEDLLDRGDGAIFSTLTRRSPYAEEGLADISMDMSIKESDGSILDSSILDVSDINSSISFSAGEGVMEVATLIALQTIWRIVKRFWHIRKTEKSIDNVAVAENETGLYVIRQRNKSKGFRSPIRTTNIHKSELVRNLDENNNNSTKSLIHNNVNNSSNKDELSEQSSFAEIDNNKTSDTFSNWIERGHHSENIFKTISSEANLVSKTPSNQEIHAIIPNYNNNAHTSKRKRKENPKRYSDSGGKADCEECDHSDNTDNKRGRTVYKTRETLDKCYAKNHDRSGNNDNSHETNAATRARQVCTKKQSYKQGSGFSASRKSTRKKVRLRRSVSKQNRKICNEVKNKIDKLSQDLSNASMDDNIGGYWGDSSDDFADDSSSSSDEKSEIKQYRVLEMKVLESPPSTSFLKGGLKVSRVKPCIQNKTDCSCGECKRNELNDIMRKLRFKQSNAGELKHCVDLDKTDNIPNILAWAWSCVEN